MPLEIKLLVGVMLGLGLAILFLHFVFYKLFGYEWNDFGRGIDRLFGTAPPPEFNFNFIKWIEEYPSSMTPKAKQAYIEACQDIIETYQKEMLDPTNDETLLARRKYTKPRTINDLELDLFERYKRFLSERPTPDGFPPFTLFPPLPQDQQAIENLSKDLWFQPWNDPTSPFKNVVEALHPYRNGVKRFEGTFILAPSGSGKTTLLNYLISQDFDYLAFKNAFADEINIPGLAIPSIIAMDSTGEFLKHITAKKHFHPTEGVYRDRLIVIEPDVETPIALNPFAFGRSRLKSYGPRDREKMANNTIDLLAHVFSTIGEGAKFTPRQALLFRQAIRLCLEIPNSNLSTLATIFSTASVDQYAEYVSKLDDTAQDFWHGDFRTVDFKKVCGEVSWRLSAVLENATFAKMLNAPDCKVDFFKALNEGSVVVINTDRAMLGEERAGIFGRLIISLIRLAMRERDTLPEKDRKPVYFYIDEVHEYLDNDDQVAVMIDDVRKARLALVMVTQRLAKLKDGNVRDALLSCGILMAKPTPEDARQVATYMHTHHDFISSLPPHTFALFARNVTQVTNVSIPNFQPEWDLSKAEQERTIRENKARYGYKPSAVAPRPPKPTAVKPVQNKPGPGRRL